MVEFTKLQKIFWWINLTCLILIILFLSFLIWGSGYLETEGLIFVLKGIFKLNNVFLLSSMAIFGMNILLKSKYIIPATFTAIACFITHQFV